MATSERRHLERFSLRVPLRFRSLGLASDKTEHFTAGAFFGITIHAGTPFQAAARATAAA